MKIKEGKEDWWKTGLKNNQDFYGLGIYMFAERWANEMERIINMGINPENAIVANAEECGRKANIDGITGFMYGAAVSILGEVWEYGDILLKWHRHEYSGVYK